MKKLKTLKDIKTPADFADISSLEVRQEAIKEIKILRKAISYEGKGMPKFLCPFKHIEDWRGHIGSIIVYIKWKFNITEKELE